MKILRALLVLVALHCATSCAPLVHQPGNAAYPHAHEPIGDVRTMYDGQLTPEQAVNTFRNIDRLFPSSTIHAPETPRPLPYAAELKTDLGLISAGKRYSLAEVMELNRIVGMLIMKDGKVVLEQYRLGNTPATRWMSMSVAKSMTSTMVGAAVQDGYIKSLNDPITLYVPRLKGTAYEGVTVRNILNMNSGMQWNETYTDPKSDRRALLEAQISQKPGAALEIMAHLQRVAEQGTRWNYSTGETQLAGEIVRGATGKSLTQYLEEKLWQPLGMEADATWWLESPDGHEIAGSGMGVTLRDYARFGEFFLDGGLIDRQRVLPEGWTRQAGQNQKSPEDPDKTPYGYMWWPVDTEDGRRDAAFAAEGIFGQHIYINPAQRVVAVILSAQTTPTGGAVVNEDDVYDSIGRAFSQEKR